MVIDMESKPDITMKLHETADRFVFTSSDANAPALVVDRINDRIYEDNKPFEKLAPSNNARDIFGIVGVINLLGGRYVVVVIGHRRLGEIKGCPVYASNRCEILSVKKSANLSGKQKADEAEYLRLLREFLDLHTFYYSHYYNLSKSYQAQLKADPDTKSKKLWEQADWRFVYNAHLLQPLIEVGASNWILPMITGFVQIEYAVLRGYAFDFILISRRANGRQGPRFHIRGIDKSGNVANYAETEQMVIKQGCVASYLQTRGSIPVFWNQPVNMKYTPKAQLTGRPEEDRDAFSKHFADQRTRYGKQVLVDLVDHKKWQLTLGGAYATAVKDYAHPDLRYVSFDFHHECRKMKYENLSKLDDIVAEDHTLHGYLETDENDIILQEQRGVMRTNCVDCLDRTNVVQTRFARKSLQQQLQNFCVIRPGEQVDSYEKFESMFKNVWANNADAISLLYSGTGALKNDYTRTGKRNLNGMINDGINSVTRYFLNNLYDGEKLDSINLFLGKYKVLPMADSPFSGGNNRNRLYMFMVQLAAVWYGLIWAIENYALEGEMAGFLTLAMWLGYFGALWKLVQKRGKNFVSNARLNDES